MKPKDNHLSKELKERCPMLFQLSSKHLKIRNWLENLLGQRTDTTGYIIGYIHCLIDTCPDIRNDPKFEDQFLNEITRLEDLLHSLISEDREKIVIQPQENKQLAYHLQNTEDVSSTIIVRCLASLDVTKKFIMQGRVLIDRHIPSPNKEDASLWHDLWEYFIYSDEDMAYFNERCDFWQKALKNMSCQ